MRLYLYIPLCCLLGGYSPHATAKTKTVTLESFDGHPTRVTLYHKPFGNPFYVSTSTDRFVIDDYWSEVDTRLINRHFLQLTYAVRCGTNTGMRHTALICVSKGKLYQAAHLVSYYSSYDDDNDNLYQVDRLQLKLTGNGSNTYRLLLTHCAGKASAPDGKEKIPCRLAGTLRFDPVNCCFYSSRKAITKTFRAYNPRSEKLAPKRLAGVYPCLRIDQREYYLVDREWYEAGRQNYLQRFSYR